MRTLLLLFLTLATLAVVTPGCTAWRESHPTGEIIDHATDVGSAALTGVATGNWLPFATSALNTVSWLFAGGAAVVARQRGKRINELVSTGRRRGGDATPATSSPPASPAPSPQA